jgi:tetratricopeptide (TPR) repeat protein
MYQRFVDRQPRLRSLSHHDEALMRLLDGRIKRSFGNAISSKECLEAVRTLLIEHGDAYEIAEVYNQLGFTYQEVSYHYSLANKYAPDWDAQAEKYHQKALTLSWALGDIRATIQAYIGLSCLYAAQNHSMPAHTILRAALKLAIEYTDARITGIILGLLGQVLIAHQKFDRALELLVLSVKLAEAAHDIRSLGIRHGWIALVNSALGRRHAAITAVIKARDYVSEAGTKRDIDFVEFCYSTVFKLPVDMETKKEVMEVAKDGSLIYS